MQFLSPACACKPVQIASASSGGDEGFASFVYFNQTLAFDQRVLVTFEPFSVPDRLQLYTPDQSTLLWDTKCCSDSFFAFTGVVLTPAPINLVFKAGWNSVYVIVTGSCHGGSGTAWNFRIDPINTGLCFGKNF